MFCTVVPGLDGPVGKPGEVGLSGLPGAVGEPGASVSFILILHHVSYLGFVTVLFVFTHPFYSVYSFIPLIISCVIRPPLYFLPYLYCFFFLNISSLCLIFLIS